MKINSHATRAAVFLFSILMSVSAFSLDSDAGTDAEEKAKKAPAAEEEAKSGGAAPATADDPHGHGMTAAEIAKAATDPSAVLTQFQNLFWTTGSSDDKNISNTYLFQPVLPLSKNNVLRPALPVISTSGKTGIGDLFLLDVFLNQVKTGTWGWGIAGSVPIGDKEFSTEKWQAGPTLLYMNKTSKKVLWGILGYNEWSFAGKSSAADVNVLSFQPIYVVHTNWGYWGWTDQLATVDWEKDNQTSIPLGLRFGKVYHGKTPLNASVGFYYTLNDNGRDDVFGLKVTATFIKPTWLRH